MFPDDIDADQLRQLTQKAKQHLRTRMRAVRQALPETAREARSQAIITQIVALPVFQDCRSLALFWPLLDRGEVDLRPLDAQARAAHKAIYYPFLEKRDGKRISGLRRVDHTSELAAHGQRFFEPPANAPVALRGDIDLLILPALAVDEAGHRLGYGMGFYDSLLPDLCPPAATLVVAYDSQLLCELPREEHDVPCQWVVTDRRVLRCSRLPP